MCSLICVNTSFGSRPALNARHDTTKSENFPFASPQDKPSNAPREVSWGHLQEGGLAWLCGPLERQFSLNCYALPVVIVRIPTVGFPRRASHDSVDASVDTKRGGPSWHYLSGVRLREHKRAAAKFERGFCAFCLRASRAAQRAM